MNGHKMIIRLNKVVAQIKQHTNKTTIQSLW